MRPGWLEVAVPFRTHVQTMSCIATTDCPWACLSLAMPDPLRCHSVKCMVGTVKDSRGGLPAEPHCLHTRPSFNTSWSLQGDASPYPEASRPNPGTGGSAEAEGSKLNACLVALLCTGWHGGSRVLLLSKRLSPNSCILTHRALLMVLRR